MNKVKVESNGIIIGYTYDEGKTIDFLDNDEAKKVLLKLNTGMTIGISSRKTGNVDETGNIINVSDLNELNFINTK
jgi:hypothetical protein